MSTVYFLALDGVKGDSLDSKYAGWFEVSGFDIDLENLGSSATSAGGGTGTGKAVFSPLTLTLDSNTGLAPLLTMAASGQHLKGATLVGVTAGAEHDKVYQLDLADLLVTKVEDDAGAGLTLSLDYSKIELETFIQDDKGAVVPEGQFGFDLKANQGGGGAPSVLPSGSVDPSPQPATYFMLIDGLNGGSTDKLHKGWFEITSFDLDLENIGSLATGSGSGAGKAVFSPLNVTLAQEAGLADVMDLAATGGHIKGVRIEGFSAGKDQVEVYELNLADVLVTKVADGEGDGYSLSLDYSKIALVTNGIDETGKPTTNGEFGYDLNKNIKIDPFSLALSPDSSGGSVSPAQYFLALDGVKGDSLDSKYAGWFEVSGFDIDLENLGSSATSAGGGTGTGKAVFSPLTLTLDSNTGLAPLLTMAASGQHLKGATLVGVTAGAEHDKVYQLDLADLLVTKVEDDAGAGLTLSLDYSKIELETFIQDDKGAVVPEGQFGFDLKANQGGGGAPSVLPSGSVDPSPQPATYFMLIDGLNGGSTDKLHKGWFEITSFDLDLENIGSLATGSGSGAGKAVFSPLNVTLAQEAGLADVMDLAATGGHIKGVRIEGFSAGKDQVEVYELNLADVLVTKVADGEGDGYSLSLDYSKIALVTNGIDETGKPTTNGEFGYDLNKNIKIDPFSLALSPDSSGGSVSPAQYFLALDGVKGDSLDSKYAGWFEVSGFDIDLENLGSSATSAGGGTGTGKAVFSPLTLTLDSNTGLAPLLTMAASGQHLKGATLVGVTAGAEHDKVYQLDLADLLVTKVEDDAGAGLTLSLDYSKIELETFIQDDKGAVVPEGQFGFDLKANQGGGGAPSVLPSGSVDPSPQPATYFMLIDGLNGGSTDKLHKGWFEITSFDLDLENIGSLATGSGSGAGKAVFSPLNVTLAQEAGLADVMDLAATGGHIKGVRIEGFSAGKDQVEVYELNLADVLVTKVADGEGDGYSLSLDYSKIALVTNGIDETGKPTTNGEFGYDLNKNIKIDPFSLALSPGGNDAPVANAQSITTDEDTATAVPLSGSDVNGDSLTFIVASGPAHGTLSGSGVNLTYTPDRNYNGSDSFTYVANDGAADSTAATFSITVNAVNDAPVANAQSITTDEDTATAVTLSGSDADGDSLTFTVVSGPAHGTLSGIGANLTYTPDPNYNGLDSFTYVANDKGAVVPEGQFGFDLKANQGGGGAPSVLPSGSVDPSPQPATYFMLIDGLNGGSTDKLHKGWFEITSFDLDLENIGSLATGSGSGAGKAVFSPLNVTLAQEAGLADVMDLAATGGHIKGVRIEGFSAGKDQVEVYELNLADVLVTKVADGEGDGYSLSLDYSKIALVTNGIDETGKPTTNGEFGYDLNKNIKIDPFSLALSPDSSGGSVSPAQYFLALDGVKGDSLDSKYAGWFEVSGFDIDLENLGSSATSAGGGTGTGKAVFSPLTLTLDSNTGLAPLLTMAASGQHLKGATLVGVTAGAEHDKVYQLDLADLLVTKVEDDAGAGLTLSLDYSKIELETFIQDDKGAVVPEGQFGFDLKANQGGGGAPSVLPSGSVDPSPQPATYFMLIDGLNGGSTDKLHKGWFEITSFDLDLENIGSLATGSGSGAGKAVFSPLNVTLAQEAGLADVMDLAATGGHIKGVRIEGFSAGKDQVEVYELNLADVLVTKVADGEGDGYSLSLDYSKIALVTNGIDETGKPTTNGEFGYDLNKNIKIDPFSLALSPDSSGGSVSPAQYFLALDGVKGDSLDSKYAGWFEVSGFDIDLENLGSSATSAGGGTGTGKAVFSPLTLTLDSNTGLAPLLTMAASGQHLKGATLVGVTAGAEHDKVYQLDLADLLVTKVEDDAGAGLTLSLDYSKIELETFIQDDKGAVVPEGQFGFDLKANQGGGGAPSVLPSGSVDPSPQPATYFMLIDGLNGGSTDKLHKGWFEITSFDLDLENIGSLATGSGSGAGKAVFSPLNVTLAQEAGLADVMDLAATGGHIKGVRIEGFSAGKDQVEVYELNLADVLVTKVADGEGDGYSLSLDYSKIALVTNGIDETGKPTTNGEFGYDLNKNIKIDPFSLALSPDSSGGSVSPAQYFLALDGVKGDSLDSKYAGWFEVSGFDIDLENLGSSATSAGGGTGTGKAVFSPLTLTLDSNTGLAPLLTMAASGQHLKGATLVGVTAGAEHDKVYQLDLADLLVTKVEDDAGAGLTLSLDYSKIELETFIQHHGSDSAAATVSLTVNSVNDAPVYTSPATFVVVENGTTVGTVTATDPDSNPVTFARVGGADQTLFAIDPTGALRFNVSPDFETPEDANGDNVYDLVVSATDSLGAVTFQTVAIQVTNVAEPGQTINGGNSNQTLVGTNGNDVMNGGNGNDNLNGGDGNDGISGGNGKDILVGGRGDDNMSGGNDNDSLEGGLGNDSLSGGNGKDILVGGSGNDLLDGGNDDDVIQGGVGNDTLTGGNGDDIMDAGAGNDTLNGGNGKDTMEGGDGNDHLQGGSGDDRLVGGTGNDELTGGVGDDQLVFHAGFGHDVVTDFNRRDDVIVFHEGLFGSPQAVLTASQQVGGDTVITLDADNSIVLQDVLLQSLAANDFLFLN